MHDDPKRLEADRRMLAEAQAGGTLAKLATYARLSGPGWLQSAITLGGGSLASSLFLGGIAGHSLLWVQPFAMVLGVIMLSTIGYVTLTTGQRPFQAINEHVNPVLGWGWALASLLASMVWALPQYSLATGVIEQNLLPGVFGREGSFGGFEGRAAIAGSILVLTTLITWSYGRGGRGIRVYELVLKAVVGLIVICFAGVVVKLVLSDARFDWRAVLGGFVPDFSTVFRPSQALAPHLAAIAETSHREFWEGLIVAKQRDILVSAAATAVGINMTFLFPYSLLRRGWGREHRGLAAFDLGTGMFIPYVLATSCVVIAAAHQFHAGPHDALRLPASEPARDLTKAEREYHTLLENRVRLELPEDASRGEVVERCAALSGDEKVVAASLVTRSAQDLARSLEPLTGTVLANVIFGLGVLAMALSTITLLMLISGFVICEVFSLPHGGWPYRFATLAAASGVLGPFVWSEYGFWLAVPASIFGFMLLPLAYVTFFLLLNQRRFLAGGMPSGAKRAVFNTAAGLAALTATAGSIYMIWQKAAGWTLAGRIAGLGALGVFLLAVAAVQVSRRARRRAE